VGASWGPFMAALAWNGLPSQYVNQRAVLWKEAQMVTTNIALAEHAIRGI